MKFARKTQVGTGIPTTSLPDIVFLLLLFFMVSSVFQQYRGIPVRLPAAQKIEKLPGKRSVANIWADDKGRISIDDKFLDVKEVSDIIYVKVTDPLNPLRVISLKIDERAKMGFITKIHDELRETGGAALNVNYSTKTASN